MAADPMTSSIELDVAVVGEALVDVVERAGETAEVPGGSPMNVAIGLGRLGRSTSLVARVGEDRRGDLVRLHLSRAGVELRALVPSERTSVATAHIGVDGAATYEFDIEWSLPTGLEVPSSRLLHVGSIGSWMEPGALAVAEFVRARPRGRRASFDPNIRPSLIGDRPAAVALIRDIAAHVDLVKLSDEDAAWLWPRRTPDDVLRELIDLGAGIAVITRGADGAIARTLRHRVQSPAWPAHVVDTIGAGDSFMAGLLDAWLDLGAPPGAELTREALEAMVGRSLRVAAVTVSRMGADPPWARELDRNNP